MNKIIKLLLKVIIGIVVLVVLLLVTATVLLNTQSVQDDLAKYATEQLELKLGTRVKIDKASVNLFTQKVNLISEPQALYNATCLFLESWNRRQRVMSVPAIILQWFINAYADIVILIEDFPINFNRFIQSYQIMHVTNGLLCSNPGFPLALSQFYTEVTEFLNNDVEQLLHFTRGSLLGFLVFIAHRYIIAVSITVIDVFILFHVDIQRISFESSCRS